MMDNLAFSEEEIQQQLELLGYKNISKEKLQEFKKDLDGLIRSGQWQSLMSPENSEIITPNTSPPAFTKEKVGHYTFRGSSDGFFLHPQNWDHDVRVLSPHNRDFAPLSGRCDSYAHHTVATKQSTVHPGAPSMLQVEPDPEETLQTYSYTSTPGSSSSSSQGRRFIKRKVLSHKMNRAERNEDGEDDENSLYSSFWSDRESKDEKEETESEFKQKENTEESIQEALEDKPGFNNTEEGKISTKEFDRKTNPKDSSEECLDENVLKKEDKNKVESSESGRTTDNDDDEEYSTDGEDEEVETEREIQAEGVKIVTNTDEDLIEALKKKNTKQKNASEDSSENAETSDEEDHKESDVAKETTKSEKSRKKWKDFSDDSSANGETSSDDDEDKAEVRFKLRVLSLGGKGEQRQTMSGDFIEVSEENEESSSENEEKDDAEAKSQGENFEKCSKSNKKSFVLEFNKECLEHGRNEKKEEKQTNESFRKLTLSETSQESSGNASSNSDGDESEEAEEHYRSTPESSEREGTTGSRDNPRGNGGKTRKIQENGCTITERETLEEKKWKNVSKLNKESSEITTSSDDGQSGSDNEEGEEVEAKAKKDDVSGTKDVKKLKKCGDSWENGQTAKPRDVTQNRSDSGRHESKIQENKSPKGTAKTNNKPLEAKKWKNVSEESAEIAKTSSDNDEGGTDNEDEQVKRIVMQLSKSKRTTQDSLKDNKRPKKSSERTENSRDVPQDCLENGRHKREIQEKNVIRRIKDTLKEALEVDQWKSFSELSEESSGNTKTSIDEEEATEKKPKPGLKGEALFNDKKKLRKQGAFTKDSSENYGNDENDEAGICEKRPESLTDEEKITMSRGFPEESSENGGSSDDKGGESGSNSEDGEKTNIEIKEEESTSKLMLKTTNSTADEKTVTDSMWLNEISSENAATARDFAEESSENVRTIEKEIQKHEAQVRKEKPVDVSEESANKRGEFMQKCSGNNRKSTDDNDDKGFKSLENRSKRMDFTEESSENEIEMVSEVEKSKNDKQMSEEDSEEIERWFDEEALAEKQSELNQPSDSERENLEKTMDEESRGSSLSPAVSLMTSGYGTYQPEEREGAHIEELDERLTVAEFDRDSLYSFEVYEIDQDENRSVKPIHEEATQRNIQAADELWDGKRLNDGGEGVERLAAEMCSEPSETNDEDGVQSNKGIKFIDSKVDQSRTSYQRMYEEWEGNLRRPIEGASCLEERLADLCLSPSVRHDSENEELTSRSESHSSEGLSEGAFESYIRGMSRSHSEGDIRPKPKSFIRPVLGQTGPKKTDPVAKYFQYKQLWDMFKLPGENDRKALRWEIKERLAYQPPPPKPRKVFVPNTYTVPTEKKRSALRWEIRNDMANGNLPHSYNYRF